MTARVYASISLLQSRRLREWAKEDGIDENDPALVRLANALDRLRRRYHVGETRAEYKAEQESCRTEYRAAIKAYREAHGKHSIRGRVFAQAVASEGCLIQVKGFREIPFVETDIESVDADGEPWNFRRRAVRTRSTPRK